MKEIQDELIDEKNREDLHSISQKIVAVESALFLASQIIELKRFLTSIDQETVNIYFTEVRNIREPPDLYDGLIYNTIAICLTYDL